MRKYIFTAIVPITIFFIGIAVTLIDVYRNEGNFFSIQTAITKEQLQFPTTQLKTDDLVRGSFTAKYDNLGWVGVRFTTHFRINEDTLIFRIRNLDDQHWMYQNKYKTDQFQPNQIFPFGFPTIPNSKDKTYVFEIETIDGSEGNGVSINTQFPIAVASYTLDKQYYLSAFGSVKNKTGQINIKILSDFLSFLLNKTSTLIVLGQYADSFILYLSPVPIYIFWYWLVGSLSPAAIKFISSHRFITLVSILLILARIFVFKSNSSFYSFFIVASWITGTILYRSYHTAQARNFVAKNRWLILIIPLLMIVKAFFMEKSQDNMMLTIVLLWFSGVVIYKFKNTVNYYACLFFLILTVLLYISGTLKLAEQSAAWVIVFFGFMATGELFSQSEKILAQHAK
jgi:hypothetical protein